MALTCRQTLGAKWLLRGGALAGALAVAGVNLRCDRPLEIAVWVDVSPSTRGAAFRDERSVRARLTPLLAGRPYTLRYFADGEQPTAVEPAVDRTRLPAPTGADAVVLMSDGRMDVAAGLPPTYVVLDPALDAPPDARVHNARRDAAGLAADVVAARAGQALRMTPGGEVARPPAGPSVVTVPRAGVPDGDVRLGFDAADAWPENDAIVLPPLSRPRRRVSVDLALPGFETVSRYAAANLARDLDVTVVVVPTESLDRRNANSLAGAIRSHGGTLVLAGPADALTSEMKISAPLLPDPPQGPQDWIVLLDASGSMASPVRLPTAADPDAATMLAGGRTRWERALTAAAAALGRLNDSRTAMPLMRVTVMRFAGDLRTISTDANVDAAIAALADQQMQPPGGPTGLRAALEAIARDRQAAGRGPTRVVLLTDGDADVGDPTALAGRLRAAGVTLDAVASGPAEALRLVAEQTGGRAATRVDVFDWNAAMGAAVGRAYAVVDQIETWPGTGPLAGMSMTSTRRWPASAQSSATVVAGGASPVIAYRDYGLGRIVSVAADLRPVDLAELARRFERPMADPRFAVRFDERTGLARLTAFDAGRPMNDLDAKLSGATEARFERVGPGTYEAPLPRPWDGGSVTAWVNGGPVAWHEWAKRYRPEFEAVGNDRAALADVARSTGGSVIEAGDNRPLPLPRRTELRPVDSVLTVTAAVLLLAGVWQCRSPTRRPR